MTNEAAASAWDSMTDQQKVEWLATKVMGWELHNRVWHKRNNDGLKSLSATAGNDWNPLTDWNHLAQVLERCSELDMKWELPLSEIADKAAICRKIYSEYHAR